MSPPVGIESGTSVILVWRSPYWANLSSVHAPLDSWSQTIYLGSRELYKDLKLAQKGEHQNGRCPRFNPYCTWGNILQPFCATMISY